MSGIILMRGWSTVVVLVLEAMVSKMWGHVPHSREVTVHVGLYSAHHDLMLVL